MGKKSAPSPARLAILRVTSWAWPMFTAMSSHRPRLNWQGEGWRRSPSCRSYPDGVPDSDRRPAGRILALHAAAIVAVAACTAGHVKPGPAPNLAAQTTTTTSTIDFSTVDLAKVDGRRVVTVALVPGTATL